VSEGRMLRAQIILWNAELMWLLVALSTDPCRPTHYDAVKKWEQSLCWIACRSLTCELVGGISFQSPLSLWHLVQIPLVGNRPGARFHPWE